MYNSGWSRLESHSAITATPPEFFNSPIPNSPLQICTTMPKGRKSKAQEAAMDVDGQSPEGHVKNDADTTLEILRDLEHDDGPALLKAMAHFLAKRESFSKAKFADVANFFKLGDKDFDEWPNIKLPDALLPNSVFQSFCRTTLCSFANPGPISELANEAGMRLFLSGSFQSLVALFGGILCERLLPGTDLNKGGKIPANIFCQDLIIYVRELKSCGKIQDNKEFSDFLAQMMCELHGMIQILTITLTGAHTHYY
ncbi:hypothetical protein B0H13DRAFT_655535 [Mycena leptocephala]|nr:hypothetical protein B0H13DRAFT_655535 [Mycena leptocephala]